MEPVLGLFLSEREIKVVHESFMFMILKPTQMTGRLTLTQAVKDAENSGMLSFLLGKRLSLISIDVISNHWVFKKI